MAIRVGLVGTGNVGRLCLRQLVEDPRFELVGVSVSDPAKDGVDAGHLLGLKDPVDTGVNAAVGLEPLIALKPEAVVYCAMGDTRPIEALSDVKTLLAAGIHVIGSAPNTLQYPWGVLPDRTIDDIEQIAQASGTSVFMTGVDPGFASDLAPFAFLATCQRVEQVVCQEIADYATYDGVEVMVDVMGFGRPTTETPLLFLPGILAMAWGTTIRQLAAGIGVEVDEIQEFWEAEPAPETYEIAACTIEKGSIAALHFTISGMVDGHPAIVVEHVTRTRDDLRPDWPTSAQPGGSYRVLITGEPSYTIDICPTSEVGDHNHAAIVAAAGRIVNSVPDVVAAPPGIRIPADLPLPTGHGTYRAPA